MKKIMLLAAGTVITLGIANTVFASESASLKSQAGITPDNILYPVDKAMDNIKIVLCFSDSSKASAIIPYSPGEIG